MKCTVPVESRKARAIASGMSAGMQESSGVVKTTVRGPSSTALILGVVGTARADGSRAVCAGVEIANRAKPHRAGSMRLIIVSAVFFAFGVNTAVGESTRISGIIISWYGGGLSGVAKAREGFGFVV